MAVLAVAAGVAVLLAVATKANLAIGLAMAWGIGWIAVARLTGAPESTVTGVAAALAALVAIGVSVALRVRASTGSPAAVLSS